MSSLLRLGLEVLEVLEVLLEEGGEVEGCREGGEGCVRVRLAVLRDEGIEPWEVEETSSTSRPATFTLAVETGTTAVARAAGETAHPGKRIEVAVTWRKQWYFVISLHMPLLYIWWSHPLPLKLFTFNSKI